MIESSPSARESEAPRESFSPWTMVALVAANALGYSATLAIPLWLPDVASRFGLAPWMGGVLGTVQLASAALAVIMAAAFLPAASPRKVTQRAAILAAVGYGLASLPSFWAFLPGIILAGAGGGACLATVNSVIARLPNPQRRYAVLVGLHVAFGATFYLLAPRLQLRFGSASLFPALSILAIVATLALGAMPRGAPASTASARGRMGARAAIALCAFALLFAGQESVIAFLVVIARHLGITVRSSDSSCRPAWSRRWWRRRRAC